MRLQCVPCVVRLVAECNDGRWLSAVKCRYITVSKNKMKDAKI